MLFVTSGFASVSPLDTAEMTAQILVLVCWTAQRESQAEEWLQQAAVSCESWTMCHNYRHDPYLMVLH